MEINEQIDEVRKSLEAVISEIELISIEFIDRCKDFTADLYKKTVDDYVKTKFEHTKDLGVTKLSEMKKDLQALIGNVPQIVVAEIDQDKCWVHRPIVWPYSINNKNGYTGLNNAIGELYRYVGDLLNKYGYEVKQQRKLDGFTMTLRNDTPEYLRVIFSQYDKSYAKLYTIKNQLDKLLLKKEQNEALKLWDNI